MILLNPGPVTLTHRVKNSLLKDDLCHREPEFGQLQQDIREKLLQVYGLDDTIWTSVILTGSGTAAVEALITSLTPKKSNLLIVENGVYGERISKIARASQIANYQIKSSWTESIDLIALEKALSSKKYSHVALVHHETTTGRLNKLDQIFDLCRRYDCKVLLDAVSSFGAENISFEGDIVTGVAATANKCLHGVPGISFVIANRKDLMIQKNPERSAYLNLYDYFSAQENKSTPYTQSIQCMYALNEALDEYIEAGGLEERQSLYKIRMKFACDFLEDIGINSFLKEDLSSCVLRSFYIPKNFTYEIIHNYLKDRGFIIYSGQGYLQNQLFRLSFMGCISKKDMTELKLAFRDLFT